MGGSNPQPLVPQRVSVILSLTLTLPRFMFFLPVSCLILRTISVVDCGKPPKRGYAIRSMQQTTFGSVAHYSCLNPRHLLVGKTTTHCDANCVPAQNSRGACSSSSGNWSVTRDNLPHCRCKSNLSLLLSDKSYGTTPGCSDCMCNVQQANPCIN